MWQLVHFCHIPYLAILTFLPLQLAILCISMSKGGLIATISHILQVQVNPIRRYSQAI